MIDNKLFAGGGLNFDDDYHLMSKSDWIDAKNVRINSTANGYKGAVVNIKGTTSRYEIEFPNGTYVSVGARGFDNVGKIFMFLALVEGVDPDSKIVVWDVSTNTGTILVDKDSFSTETDVLNFDLSRRINHIDLVDEKYLYWVESADNNPVNPPRMLDITKNYGAMTEKSLSVIKQPPLLPISNVKAIDCVGGGNNNIGSEAWYFKYRYIYWDNSKSAYSPVSAIGNQRSRGNSSISTYAEKVFDSAIQFNFNGGGSLVKGVEIIARRNDSSDWVLIDSFDFQNNEYGKVMRIGYAKDKIFAGSFYDLTITYNGTPTVLSSLLYDNSPSTLITIYNALIASPLNNNLYITLTSGDSSFGFVEITTKNSTDTLTITPQFPATILVTTIKSAITNTNASNTYTFLDARRNQAVDQAEANSPFDYVPLFANSQATPNGNYLAYGDYTEGYDNVNIEAKVQFSEQSTPILTYGVTVLNVGSGDRAFQFSGTFNTSQMYSFLCRKTAQGSYWVSIPAYETDTEESFLNRVATSFSETEGNANVVYNYAIKRITILGDPATQKEFEAVILTRNSYSIHKSDAQYKVTLAYMDDYGRFGAANAFAGNIISLPSQIYAAGGSGTQRVYNVPTLKIYNQAPSWASKFIVLRSKRINIGKFISSPFDDTGITLNNDGTGTISLIQLSLYNSDFVADLDYNFVAGDRLVINDLSFGQISVVIKEIAENTLTFYQGGLSNQMVSSINSNLSTAWFQLVANNVADLTDIYYEVALIGNIVNGNHQAISAGDVSQSGATPASIQMVNGDSFIRMTSIRPETALIVDIAQYREIDVFSDYVQSSSATNSGRPNQVNPFEKQSRYPAAMRHGGAYVIGTEVNNINSFDVNSYKEASLVFGPIQKMDVDGSMMIIGQRLRLARAGIFEAMFLDKEGTETVAISEKLLSEVGYYDYEVGIGDCPEAYCKWGSTKWGVDKNRGVVWRLSKSGITPISITAKANSYFVPKLKTAVSVYTGFDPTNQELYITILDGVANETIVFSENDNRFSMFWEGIPTSYVTLYQNLYAFSGNFLWELNNSSTYNNIFGVQKNSNITFVGNDNPAVKKSFLAISEIASELWAVPTINTDLSQESSLVSGNFKQLEGEWHAAFLRDSRTRPGVTNPLFNGPSLKGKWIKCKLQNTSTNFVYLLSVGIKYIISPQTGV